MRYPASMQSFSNLLDLAYSKETLHKSRKDLFWASADCCWDTVSNQGLSAIGTAGSVITMNNPAGIIQKFGLARLQRLDAIRTDSHSRRHLWIRKLCSQGAWACSKTPKQRNTRQQLILTREKDTKSKKMWYFTVNITIVLKFLFVWFYLWPRFRACFGGVLDFKMCGTENENHRKQGAPQNLSESHQLLKYESCTLYTGWKTYVTWTLSRGTITV